MDDCYIKILIPDKKRENIFNLIISSFNYSKYFDILFIGNDYLLIYPSFIEKSFNKFKFRVLI